MTTKQTVVRLYGHRRTDGVTTLFANRDTAEMIAEKGGGYIDPIEIPVPLRQRMYPALYQKNVKAYVADVDLGDDDTAESITVTYREQVDGIDHDIMRTGSLASFATRYETRVIDTRPQTLTIKLTDEIREALEYLGGQVDETPEQTAAYAIISAYKRELQEDQEL